MDLDEHTSLTLTSREYIEHTAYRARRRTCTLARFVEILSFVEYFVEQVSCVERVFFPLVSICGWTCLRHMFAMISIDRLLH